MHSQNQHQRLLSQTIIIIVMMMIVNVLHSRTVVISTTTMAFHTTAMIATTTMTKHSTFKHLQQHSRTFGICTTTRTTTMQLYNYNKSNNVHRIRRFSTTTISEVPNTNLSPLSRNKNTFIKRYSVSPTSSSSSNSAGEEKEVMNTNNYNNNNNNNLMNMENIYQEWTLQQDEILWEHRFDTTISIAILLGRGLRGIEQRLTKLRTINSPAYNRLFVRKNKNKYDDVDYDKNNIHRIDDTDDANNDGTIITKKKLPPSSEVIRRIQWDESIVNKEDFSIVHYDRVDDTLIETPFTAPNQSISGKATKFIDAIPEHRIMKIKYKERIIWDRNQRYECVFANNGIVNVISTYNDWKKAKDIEVDIDRQRRQYISTRLQMILGEERYDILHSLWTNVSKKVIQDPTLSVKIEAEKYVKSAMQLFKQVWSEPDISPMPQWIPASDVESLELISELVVLYNDNSDDTYQTNSKTTTTIENQTTILRTAILNEISIAMLKASGKYKPPYEKGAKRKLPELNDKELTETFIRGTGPGGQKINKTSIRVCLVHDPTQIRVECQDTRSLQQNRKIARKRLQYKLDEYYNGNESTNNIKAQRASMKKSKAKARSRARMRERQDQNNYADDTSSVSDDEFITRDDYDDDSDDDGDEEENESIDYDEIFNKK